MKKIEMETRIKIASMRKHQVIESSDNIYCIDCFRQGEDFKSSTSAPAAQALPLSTNPLTGIPYSKK